MTAVAGHRIRWFVYGLKGRTHTAQRAYARHLGVGRGVLLRLGLEDRWSAPSLRRGQCLDTQTRAGMTITEVVLDAAEIRRMIENAEHSKASALSRWDRKISRLQAILDHADDQDQVRVSYDFT